MCCAGAVLACWFITQEVGGSNAPFCTNIFYRFCRFCKFFRIHLGKTQIIQKSCEVKTREGTRGLPLMRGHLCVMTFLLPRKICQNSLTNLCDKPLRQLFESAKINYKTKSWAYGLMNINEQVSNVIPDCNQCDTIPQIKFFFSSILVWNLRVS